MPVPVKIGGPFFALLLILICCKTAVAENIFGSCCVCYDSILVRILQSRTPPAFELYPDVSQEVLLFTAKGGKGKVYQLFLFSVEGKLIRQTQVRSKETTLLPGLTRGDYLFEVFSNDDRIGNGNITVK